jgi:D-xylose transport system permease protein
MSKFGIRDGGRIVTIVALVAFFAWHSPNFLSSLNLSNLGVEFAITAVLALGVFLVLLPGHTDLSTGSGVGLCGGIAAVLVANAGWPAPLAMAVALACALALWMAMGWMVVRQRIPAFIMTLSGMLVFRGLHWLITGSRTIPVKTGSEDNLFSLLTTWYLPPTAGYALAGLVSVCLAVISWRQRRRRAAYDLPIEERDSAFAKWLIATQLLLLLIIVMNQFHGLPLSVLILGLVAAAVYVLTAHTPFGRHLYAIGGNAEAARLSGIRVERTVIIAFVLCGAVVALTGFLQTAYTGSTTTTTGQLMELDAITACVIGGVSITGGIGSVSGVLFGALIMATLLNGMTLMTVPIEHKYITRGVVLALAVWMDVWLARRNRAAA